MKTVIHNVLNIVMYFFDTACNKLSDNFVSSEISVILNVNMRNFCEFI
jgi:hypothetical protein